MNDNDPFAAPWSRQAIRHLLAEKDRENDKLKIALNTLAFYVRVIKEPQPRQPALERVLARRHERRPSRRATGR